VLFLLTSSYSSFSATVSKPWTLAGSLSLDFFVGAELGAQAPAIHVEIPNFGRIQACSPNQAMMKAIKNQSSFIVMPNRPQSGGLFVPFALKLNSLQSRPD
jgi:hypothetical protein